MLTDVDRAASAPHDHVVQFYRDDADLARAAGGFLATGLRDGERAVVIATPAHLHAFAATLRRAGIDPEAARTSGALVELDAAATLAAITSDGRVDRELFERIVGDLIRAKTATGGVHAYGELVALLWDAGDVAGAIELEGYWNELLAETGCALFCAYPLEAVARDDVGRERVCGLHGRVVAPLGDAVRVFAAEARETRAARRFVVDTVRAWGYPEIADDVALVVTELVTNAVLHARSPFTVTIERVETGVRLSVRDTSPREPRRREAETSAGTGRGLALVAAFTAAWGVDADLAGKAVWAEFSA